MFPQIFGKYVLEREIAAGGMARVYLATLRGAVGFEKRLVVKQIRTELASDDAFVTRFVEEAKTAVELSHPNIVPVYELGVEQGVYYIAMELCEGLTLSEVLAETGPLGPVEGAYVGAEICRALDYAHRRAHIVHRDVTPRNVLIDDEGAVRLIDFGIAAPVTRADDPSRTEVFGSPGHMPPEQLHGAELSPATDVFAVGVLLIEAWTGYPPFRRATAQESEHALFNVPAPLDRQHPELAPISALIASSVALDARDRPTAAEHLARPLREFLKSEDSGDIARRLGERVRRARRRSRSSSPWLPGESGSSPNELKTRPLNAETVPGAAKNSASNAPGSSPVTRTFAARDEVEVWTRRLSSAPAALQPTPAATPRSRERAAEAAAAAAAAASAKAVAAGDDGGRDPSGISSSKLSRAPRNNTGIALLGAASVAFVGLAFAFAPGAKTPAVAAPVSVRTPVASAQALAAPSGPAPDSAQPPALTPPTPRLVSAHVTDASHARPAPSAPSAEPEQFGVLKLTADPRAVVEVSGPHFQRTAKSPIVGLKVPVGRYQVVFRNDTWGVPLGTQVMVVAGVSRSVHADFRLAEPAISVR
jgi:eukaryotic-like serine/threonine-protein kinase